MKTAWTKGLDQEQAKDIRSLFKGSGILRRRLITILEEKISTARSTARKEENYSSPNWALMQVGLLEREKAFEEIMSLLQENSQDE